MNTANNNRSMEERLADLPEHCWAIHPTERIPIIMRRGHKGYWPAPRDLDVDVLNQHCGVTPAQREAMLHGSMFGFDAPIADPLLHQDAT
jgi:hypothetical protein